MVYTPWNFIGISHAGKCEIIILQLFSTFFLDRKNPEQNMTISDVMVSLSLKKKKESKTKLHNYVAEHMTDGIITSVKNLSLDEIQ